MMTLEEMLRYIGTRSLLIQIGFAAHFVIILLSLGMVFKELFNFLEKK